MRAAPCSAAPRPACFILVFSPKIKKRYSLHNSQAREASAALASRQPRSLDHRVPLAVSPVAALASEGARDSGGRRGVAPHEDAVPLPPLPPELAKRGGAQRHDATRAYIRYTLNRKRNTNRILPEARGPAAAGRGEAAGPGSPCAGCGTPHPRSPASTVHTTVTLQHAGRPGPLAGRQARGITIKPFCVL